MSTRRFLLLASAFTFLFPLTYQSVASPDGGKDWDSEETVADSEIGLPKWEENACREQFDIRIWPESVILWLEQQNLRELISSPNTTETEKRELKRILAMQKAWRMTSS